MKLFLSYHNNSHRGPGTVVQNLLKGLSKTGVEVVSDLTKADIVGCLQHPGAGYNKFPKATVMGPNIFVLPNESPEIWNNFNNYIVPSEWVKNIYQTHGDKNIEVWPVGVDTDEWKPNNSLKTLDCFIYYKNRSREDLVEVVKLLKQKNLKIKIIEYGKYEEKQLKELCDTSKFAVILDDTESQGLALQQIMAKNVPCFVLNKTIWTYKGVNYQATSIPYFSKDLCGTAVDDPEHYLHLSFEWFFGIINGEEPNIKFEPRRFIEENFNLELKAREYVAILTKAFGKV